LAEGVFVGLSTIDIVYAVDRFPEPNSKVSALTQDVFVGGPATNASITFAHLGGRSTLVTTVGRHPLAESITNELRQHSIALLDLNPDFAGTPVISSIAVNSLGERNVVSANSIRINIPPPQVDHATLQQASVVLVDGHYMQACQAWAKAARSRGVPVVFDGGSWKDGADELLQSINSAICSMDFMPPGCTTEDDVIAYLKNCGVTNIAITRGAAPICFHSNTASGSMKVPSIVPIDTMGAGDIFHGAFCYFSSEGKGFVEALGEAAQIAADSCRYKGTREWMQHLTAQGALNT
jgi:sugar/nucleoside kinase (ribokinase family)